MSFDVFALIAQTGFSGAVHNVRLVDVKPADNGLSRLTVEHGGKQHELVGGGPFSEEWSRRDVGKFGCVVSAISGGRELPIGACYFRPYTDQSLRRVPELDAREVRLEGGQRANSVGWICDAMPNGFRAPLGLIPGENGQFLPDQTVEVTLRVPPEFVRQCARVQMDPEALLRSFVGDLAGVQNYVICPRADGYGSNGSDERDRAEAWLERAHGMNAIDLYQLDEREGAAEERLSQREDFADLLDDFEGHGGKPEELFAAVQALIDKQAEADS